MEVITIVEGKVPISKAREFETAYESLKQDALTPGLITRIPYPLSSVYFN